MPAPQEIFGDFISWKSLGDIKKLVEVIKSMEELKSTSDF